jgi:hypothetical protein
MGGGMIESDGVARWRSEWILKEAEKWEMKLSGGKKNTFTAVLFV